MITRTPVMAILSLFVCLLFSQAYAITEPQNLSVKSVRSGGIDGGGGLALACTTNGKTRFELLDTYQARVDFGLTEKLDQGAGFAEKAHAALDRFSKVAPLRAAIYKSWTSEFLSHQIEWQRNIQIPQSFDEGKASILLPKGDCKIVQVAYQRNDQQRAFPGQEKLVIIDQDIFDQLSEVDKAALILHEVIYLEARAYWRHTNSKYVRYLNALITSDGIKSEKQYDDVIKSMNERSNDVDHGGFKKEYNDFRDWIPSELRFTSGVYCLDFIGPSVCMLTSKVPETYTIKSGPIEFEIRNFKSYLKRASQKAFSPIVIENGRPSEDRAREGRLFLNGKDFNTADLSYKLKGLPVSFQAPANISYTVIDRLKEDVKDGNPLTLVIGQSESFFYDNAPRDGSKKEWLSRNTISISTSDLQVSGAGTFNTDFMLAGSHRFTATTVKDSESFTTVFLRNSNIMGWQEPSVYLLKDGKFFDLDSTDLEPTAEDNATSEYGHGNSI